MITKAHLNALKESHNPTSYIDALLPCEPMVTAKYTSKDIKVRYHLNNAIATSQNTKLHYRQFYINKKSGGQRLIEAPTKPLKSVQFALALFFDQLLSPTAHVHGFVKGRNTTTNALPHVNQPHLVNLDLQHFFHSISSKRVAAYLEKIHGFHKYSANITASLCTNRGCLPMGAPTSPVLSNLIFQQADNRIQTASQNNQVQYTRYSDDITLSSQNGYNLVQTFGTITTILKQEGFTIHPNKTRWQYKNTRQTVTGLTCNETVRPPREYRRLTRALLHSYQQSVQKYGDLEGKLKAAEKHQTLNNLPTDNQVDHLRYIQGRMNYEHGIITKSKQ